MQRLPATGCAVLAIEIDLAIERLSDTKHDVPFLGVVADHERLDMIEAAFLAAASHWRIASQYVSEQATVVHLGAALTTCASTISSITASS